ncbi:hypothetical protein ACXYMP_04570 [Aliiroseovarius sp. CAU 1755]
MTKPFISAALLLGLAACGPGATTTLQGQSGIPVIARATDTATSNKDTLQSRNFAIAVLPDGCQAWLGDNGIEGYADNRYDPVTGLPVCSNRLPRGAVIGDPRQTGLRDLKP